MTSVGVNLENLINLENLSSDKISIINKLNIIEYEKIIYNSSNSDSDTVITAD